MKSKKIAKKPKIGPKSIFLKKKKKKKKHYPIQITGFTQVTGPTINRGTWFDYCGVQ
jgi:hypothetical protein